MAEITAPGAAPSIDAPAGWWWRFADSDLWWSFRRSPVTVAAAIVAFLIIGAALLAPLIAPHDPYDLASLSLLDATNPPAWLQGGSWSYPLGTDNQGRDVLSTIFYGTRLSLLVGPEQERLLAVSGPERRNARVHQFDLGRIERILRREEWRR